MKVHFFPSFGLSGSSSSSLILSKLGRRSWPIKPTLETLCSGFLPPALKAARKTGTSIKPLLLIGLFLGAFNLCHLPLLFALQ